MTLDPAGLEAAAKLARSCTPTAREDARLAEQIVRAYLAATPDPPKPPPPPLVELVLELEVDGSPYPIPASAVPAASPDERLREAEPREAITALLAAARVAGVDARSALRGAPSHTGADLLNALKAEGWVLAAADREKLERICCRGMGADGGCNICAAEATR